MWPTCSSRVDPVLTCNPFVSACSYRMSCLNIVSLPQQRDSCKSAHFGSLSGQIAAAGARLDNLRLMLANLLVIGPTRTKVMHSITLSCFKVCMTSCSIIVPQTNLLAASWRCVAYWLLHNEFQMGTHAESLRPFYLAAVIWGVAFSCHLLHSPCVCIALPVSSLVYAKCSDHYTNTAVAIFRYVRHAARCLAPLT